MKLIPSVLVIISSVISTIGAIEPIDNNICKPLECVYDMYLEMASMSKCQDDGRLLTIYFHGDKQCKNWAELIPELTRESLPNHPCCSKKPEPVNPQKGLIVGGVSVPASQYPFTALLSITFTNGEGLSCGGSILRKTNPAIIITAAHCVADGTVDTATEQTFVALYADKQDPASNYNIKVPISSVVMHPDYTQNGEPDIALLFINQDLTQYTQLQAVTISPLAAGSTECCNIGDDLTVIGYGADTEGGAATETLESVDVDFMDRAACQIQYNNADGQQHTISNNMICGYRANVDSCQGDSGGPLVKQGTNEQIGVVSWGTGCARYPGVYTNIGIPNVYNWIIQQMNGDIGAPVAAPTTPPPTISGSFGNIVEEININIEWIKIVSCTEGSGNNAVFNWEYSGAELDALAQSAVTIKFQPVNGRDNPEYGNYAVIALPGTKPVQNLNNFMPVSCDAPVDTFNWIGSDIAKARLETTDGCHGSDGYNDYMYWANGNGNGIHIASGFSAWNGVCYWQWNTITGQDIEVYFGVYTDVSQSQKFY